MTTRVLLTDLQVHDFLINGYLILQPNLLDANFHASIFDEASEIFRNEGNPGNNILPRIPKLQEVFDDPVVSGAIESLLGSNYTMQPHRHAHLTKPGTRDQQWHKDSYFGYRKLLRHHQIRYIMAMYYPQDTTLQMGPTGIKPRTQYDVVRPNELRGEDLVNDDDDDDAGAKTNETIYMTCNPGTVVLIHYDIIHRGTANNTKNTFRFMFKFQFNRLEEPTRPSWNHDPRNTLYDAVDAGILQPIVKHIWNWMMGATTNRIQEKPMNSNTLEWERQLYDEDGKVRLNTAYNLGLNGEYRILIKQLNQSKKKFRYEAVFGLTACRNNREAIADLLQLLAEPTDNDYRTSSIVFIFSEMGFNALDTLPTIMQVLEKTESWLVKRYCCEALGTIPDNRCDNIDAAVQCLIKILADRDDDKDPKEASHTRFTAALSLAKLGPRAKPAVLALKDALYLDENRYVNGNALLALERIGTAESLKIVLDYLKTSRWCAKTTPSSMY